jgi:hypothetical protein
MLCMSPSLQDFCRVATLLFPTFFYWFSVAFTPRPTPTFPHHPSSCVNVHYREGIDSAPPLVCLNVYQLRGFSACPFYLCNFLQVLFLSRLGVVGIEWVKSSLNRTFPVLLLWWFPSMEYSRHSIATKVHVSWKPDDRQGRQAAVSSALLGMPLWASL